MALPSSKPSAVLVAFVALVQLTPATYAQNEQEDAAARDCFLASLAVDQIVLDRRQGLPKDDVMARLDRSFAAVGGNFLAYLKNQAELVYSEQPESLTGYPDRHNGTCLRQRVPTANVDKAVGCSFYARFTAVLRRERDRGVSREEILASLGNVSGDVRAMAALATKNVYENPTNRFDALTEYKTCLSLPDRR